MNIWEEKYRPEKLEDVVLTPRLRGLFEGILQQDVIPNMLFYGTAGTGKTTIAKVLCKEKGIDFYFSNASLDTGMDSIRETIYRYASTKSFLGNRKAIILDEADRLTNPAQDALKGIMEECSSNCSFILTCNSVQKIIDPIISRCGGIITFSIDETEKKDLMKGYISALIKIINNENIPIDEEFKDKKALCILLKKHIENYFPDFRKTISAFQKSIISAGILGKSLLESSVIDINGEKFIEILKKKNMTKEGIFELNQWITEAISLIPDYKIYAKLWDILYPVIKTNCYPKVILDFGEYMFRSSHVIDYELNMRAFCVQLMMDVEF